MSKSKLFTEMVRAEALRLGFNDCGFSQAVSLSNDSEHLETWLKKGYHGEMEYMTRNFEKRINPQNLVEGARSVISVLLSYKTSLRQSDNTAPVLSKYAYGRDYHKVIRKKLVKLISFINSSISPSNSRAFVDSAPVLDRAWAARAGLGWIGKNSNLISPKFGSFVFIGSVITNIEFEYGSPINDLCGGCAKCLEACPTRAIVRPKVVNGNKCISYFTIEYKGKLPENLKGRFLNRVFGCDICQDVCPWNHKPPDHNVHEFLPKPVLLKMTADDWNNLDEATYENLFTGTAVKRAKFTGLKRNIDFINPKR